MANAQRCQFWCQLVLEFGACSCSWVRSAGGQFSNSVGSCCLMQLGALEEFGLRVSCCTSIVFFLQIHHEPYRANSLPSKSICARQDFPLTALPTRYTFPGCQHIASPCAREISFSSEGVRSAPRTPFDGETGRKIADDAATSPGNVVAFLGCRTAGVAWEMGRDVVRLWYVAISLRINRPRSRRLAR
jgi:hypothetical protein